MPHKLSKTDVVAVKMHYIRTVYYNKFYFKLLKAYMASEG